MASTIIGMQTRKLRLNRRLLFREPVGLERIQEEYVFQTQDFDYFSTTVFLNGKTHSSVASFVTWTAGEEISYDTMVIERIEYQPEQGGLTLAIITYVGLYSTQTPTPLVTIEPILDRNWLFHNYAAIVRFVQYIGVPGSATEINLVSSVYARQTIHLQINGANIPRGIAPPGIKGVADSLAKWNLSWVTCDSRRQNCSESGQPGAEEQTLTPVTGFISYGGFSVYAVSMERFGLYGVFRLDIRDQAVYSIAGVQYICGSFPFALNPCSSYLNLPANANPIGF
jgi:hypothetical protein